MKLGEYNFRVEHRRGTIIKHADALSRYPAPTKIIRTTGSPSDCNNVANRQGHGRDSNYFLADSEDTCAETLCEVGTANKITVAYVSPSLQQNELVPEMPLSVWLEEMKSVDAQRLPTGKVLH